MSAFKVRSGSAVCKSGLSDLFSNRFANTSKLTRNHTDVAIFFINDLVASDIKAPPPVARTQGFPAKILEITRSSPFLNSTSPYFSKKSVIVHPAACSISWSASMNCIPSRSAKIFPTVLLPAPIIPTKTIVFFGA